MRKIGQQQQRLVPLMLDRFELDAELLDLLLACAARFLDILRVLAHPLRARDFVAGRVLQALQALDLRYQPAPRGLQGGDFFERFVRHRDRGF